MGENLDYTKTFARFPFALRRFLKQRLTLDDAKRIVIERMEQREANFLRVVERGVYGFPKSPYLALLNHAGCEPGDLRALVAREGVEGALRQLRAAGVYVAHEEFKGRKPIIRNGLHIPISARSFDNPFVPHHFSSESGGSTGVSSVNGVNLEQLAARAPHQMLLYTAHGVFDAPTAIWRGILPDGTLGQILTRAYSGNLPLRWFSHYGWRDSKHWVKYDLATLYMILWMRAQGAAVPFPEFVPADQPRVVVNWVVGTLKHHRRCLLHTQVSRAVRVCNASKEEGLDFSGLTIRAGGEPPTEAKVRAIRSSGARFIPNYATSGAGTLASGCARPVDGSDVHLFKDAFALITYPFPVEGFDITVPAFNLTSLLSTAPKILINVQMDDYGIVEERSCGCELETYGYSTHLREIRSYSKLTGESVTFIGNELLNILENILPSRFGGSAFDYQLQEREDARATTRIYLVISPRVEISDEREVIKTVLNALRESSAMADAARAIWEQTDTIQVRREEPIWTQRGKFMPLHIERRFAKEKSK